MDNLRTTLGNLPRVWKRVILIGFDFFALAGALLISYSLRYGVWNPPSLSQLAVVVTGPLVAIPIFIRMGLYRAVIRYLSDRALFTIIWAMTLAAVGWLALAFLLELVVQGFVPRSVPVLYWVFGLVLVAGSRYLARAILLPARAVGGVQHPLLIYGAGEAGMQLAAAVGRSGNNFVVGFIDDNAGLAGQDVAGIRVYPPSELKALIDRYAVEEVILSAPAVGLSRRQEVVSQIAEHHIKIRTLPSLAAVVQGKYLVNQIPEIDIDELLGRSSIPPDTGLLREAIEGKTIMVTGAGGSIGSELCRLVARWSPKRLVLFEANEFALYNIDRELGALRDLAVVPVLGSIGDPDRVYQAISSHQVETVFHAAAHKHVPLVEANALEGIRNNVVGTATLAQIAYDNGVSSFVLISSDKAVHPTNVMGATKRWAELIVWQKSRDAMLSNSGQRFTAVRFGNVLGSNGSVVPLFKEQIAAGGPVTLTDLEMTRFFMSIHEAAELIVQAGALSNGGDVFLLEMGESILIRELAENMIRLAGFSVRSPANSQGDIDIVVTGKRPGEKIYEELFYDKTKVTQTRHPKILRAARSENPSGDVGEALRQMTGILAAQDEQAARKLLFDFINAHAAE